ncbi:MAG: bifunctional alpha,alpha-trehalose-phosphate synthase (UDP-forming)/trehalose-phosphatase [Candidatus Cloacimonadota bacterium]|nr:bifunctional alpha,alpha-trehalose-phosphate synthase (UDP-forming)/trehalose-phosphatase [Candidatus Cloacimonadota bacterium]
MERLLIVSNRLPVIIEKRKGNLNFRPSIGGLSTGLGSFYKSYNSLWIGWPGLSSEKVNMKERKTIKTKLMRDFASYPVFLSKRDIEMYYRGFCNATIWPLFHCFTQYVVYDKNLWEAYKSANRHFCDSILKIAKPNDIIWIHDYHLMLLPKLIRERMPDATIGFFLHIPFPPFEIFHLLPWRKEILESLLGADLIGFHTYDYVYHFLESIHRILGYEQSSGQIKTNKRVVKVDSFPMGIDFKQYANSINISEVKKNVNRIYKKAGKCKMIISIDRLDYTKGILQRLEAFDSFLEKYPKYKGKVILIHASAPSRTKVEYYKLLKKRVDELIGRINGKHGTIEWTPVWYLYRSLPFNDITALYNVADVALVTPIKDGMNLIAKEFIATKTDGKGVLILSEMAGAARELGEAIIVNPNNKEEIVESIKRALEMPNEEQIENNKTMQKRLQRYNIERWAKDFMDGLSNIIEIQQQLRASSLIDKMKKKLIADYVKSNSRLLLLDYDGTLVPFAPKPQKAKPDEELLIILKSLSLDTKNEVVIVSGRDKEILKKWFGKINVGLIAEHGAWIREKGKDWKTIEPLQNNWKEKILPILEYYVDRTPGAFIEAKEFSLVWHYRKVDNKLALVRSMELKDDILHLTANLNLGVLDGNKVIEIKKVGINKGRAALRWISGQNTLEKKDWDFILSIGDDLTDEDVFAILPESAYSIKVGLNPSRARFNLDSVKDVRVLIKELVN